MPPVTLDDYAAMRTALTPAERAELDMLLAWEPDTNVLTFDDLYIWTRDDPPVRKKFELNKVQSILLDTLCDQQGIPRDKPWLLDGLRTDVLKARQQGMSTFWLALWYLKFYNCDYRQIIIISHRDQSTNRLWGTVQGWEQDCRRNLPWMDVTRPLRASSRKELLRKDTGSSIIIATAGMSDVATSGVITDVHRSETALWRDGAEDQIVGILGALPSWGNLIEESTARGFGPHKDRWDAQSEDTNAYFFPFIDSEEYEIDVPPDFVRTEDEAKMRFVRIVAGVRVQGPISDAAVYWRRKKHEQYTKEGKPEATKQEFPLTPEEAFFASAGNAYFPTAYLYALMEEMRKRPPLYVIEEGENGFGGTIEVYEEPEGGAEYVIGGDEAEGHTQDDRHDFSAGDGFRCDTGEQVFSYHGKPPGEHCANDLYALSAHYNNAVLIPERVPMGGALVNYLISLGANLYRHAMGAEGAPENTKYGFPPNHAAKGLRDQALKSKLYQAAAVYEEWCAMGLDDATMTAQGYTPSNAAREVDCPVIRSVPCIKELIHYSNLKGGKRGASSGHDDRVTSVACAQYYRQEWVTKYAELEEEPYTPAYGQRWTRRGI